MKLFGFSDLRMFFIPFFGAAASGRKFGASATEHAVVLLLGPLPGILIGCALLITSSFIREPLLLRVGFAFIFINAFNLIPVSPLDGGRLCERLLFNRRYWLEVVFRVVTIVALAALEYWLRVWFFGVIAFFLLITFSIHMKRAHAGFSLVSNYGNLPSNPADLSDDDLAALLKSVDKCLVGVNGNAKTMATLRQQALVELYDRASLRYASFSTTVLCLSAWAAGFVIPIVSIVVWIILEWQMDPNARLPLN